MKEKQVKWWHYVAFAIILLIALLGESIIDNLLK
jgi:hypothetical protein